MLAYTTDRIGVTTSTNRDGTVDLVALDWRTLDRGRSWLNQYEAEELLKLVPMYSNAELPALYRRARKGQIPGVRGCPKK